MQEWRTPKERNSIAQGHTAPNAEQVYSMDAAAHARIRSERTHSNHFADGQHRAQPSNKSCDNVSSEPLLIADSSCFSPCIHTIFMGKLWRLLFLLLHRLRNDKYGYPSTTPWPWPPIVVGLHISFTVWMGLGMLQLPLTTTKTWQK